MQAWSQLRKDQALAANYNLEGNYRAEINSWQSVIFDAEKLIELCANPKTREASGLDLIIKKAKAYQLKAYTLLKREVEYPKKEKINSQMEKIVGGPAEPSNPDYLEIMNSLDEKPNALGF